MIEKLRSEVSITHSKSSGPGGQKVNKTNSKATLQWKYMDSSIISNSQKIRFKNKYRNYISQNDIFSISSDLRRSVYQNDQQCISKLQQFIKSILAPPKKRISTKPSNASKKKRLNSKKLKGLLKEQRKKIKY